MVNNKSVIIESSVMHTYTQNSIVEHFADSNLAWHLHDKQLVLQISQGKIFQILTATTEKGLSLAVNYLDSEGTKKGLP